MKGERGKRGNTEEMSQIDGMYFIPCAIFVPALSLSLSLS